MKKQGQTLKQTKLQNIPTEITLNRPQKLFSNIKQLEVAQNKTWFKELSENLRRKTVTAVKPQA